MTPVQFYNDPNLPDIIELKNIQQTYDGKKMVVKDLNFLIENKPGQNQFVSLLGPSGCGKSSLLRYIAGLQKPTSGEVLINNKPRTDKDVVGMVFQKYSSFPWLTVLDNVALGLEVQGVPKKEREERAMDMIGKVGLKGQEKKYAQYPTLSGGQLQRVAIARSLIANPKIVLMDEPFGALDIKTRLDMQEMLNDIWLAMEEMTVVFVTHDITEAVFVSDEICIMSANPGQIVERLTVPIPVAVKRDRNLKREKFFTDFVYEIEEKMMALTIK